MEKYISPQIKILKAILKNGGKATTKEIQAITNMPLMHIHHSGRHIVNRSFVKKVTIHKNPGGRGAYSIWTIIPSQLNRTIRKITEAYGTADDLPIT